jgi:hypothetical protein
MARQVPNPKPIPLPQPNVPHPQPRGGTIVHRYLSSAAPGEPAGRNGLEPRDFRTTVRGVGGNAIVQRGT